MVPFVPVFGIAMHMPCSGRSLLGLFGLHVFIDQHGMITALNAVWT